MTVATAERPKAAAAHRHTAAAAAPDPDQAAAWAAAVQRRNRLWFITFSVLVAVVAFGLGVRHAAKVGTVTAPLTHCWYCSSVTTAHTLPCDTAD
jgi:hypothetical protein